MATKDPFGDTVNVTPSSMRKFAEALRDIAERHDAVAEWMEKDGIPGVRAKNLRTAVAALSQIGKFVGAITSAACDQVSAEGLKELEGGVALLTRYLKRTSKELAPLDTDDEKEIDQMVVAAREGLEGANPPGVEQIPSSGKSDSRNKGRNKPSPKTR